MQRASNSKLFMIIQGRAKLFVSIDTIVPRSYDQETSYCLKSVMYINSREVRILVQVEKCNVLRIDYNNSHV